MFRTLLETENSQGKAILEFAITLPFLILVTLFGADLYQNYRVHQHLNFTTREMANATFRACQGMPAGSDTTACLNAQTGVTMAYVAAPGGILEGLSIDVRLYEYDTPTSPLLKGRSTAGTPTSRLTTPIITGLKSYNDEKKEMVIVETFFTQPTFLPFISGEYYEATLF